MKSKSLNAVILNRFKTITQSAEIPGNLRLLQGNREDTVVMALSPSAIGAKPKPNKNLNMQCDGAAFEAWALLIHVHCGLRVTLTWKEEPEVMAYRGHYGRFLYRAMKFAEQYSGWFSLSPALNERVDNFRAFLHAHNFCNNIPGKEAGIKDERESKIEALFAGECAQTLRAIAEGGGLHLSDAPICRQLPVGLFEEKTSRETSVFTGRKSAIDLWTTSGDSIVIFELKAKNNMAGILSELMFYANYMADMYINHTFHPLKPPKSKASHRGYRQLFPLRFHRVQAAMLTDGLHSLITPKVLEEMNRGASNIRYYDLRYALDERDWPVQVARP